MLRLGQGREAEVYAWGESFVLKLFWPEFSREDVELEADLATKVWAAGAPAPKVEDLLEVEGRFGFLKCPYHVGRFFVHLGSRVYEFGFVMVVSLLVYSVL
ncbi:MAG: hypothetical protein K6T35_09775, partial [Meiothermus silvanus]|nr:hypothetical protein [Allomeiothermus silvanus]